jgi:signal peptidase I
VPDLPEQSRAPREGLAHRLDGGEVPTERRAVETRPSAPSPGALTARTAGNGATTRVAADDRAVGGDADARWAAYGGPGSPETRAGRDPDGDDGDNPRDEESGGDDRVRGDKPSHRAKPKRSGLRSAVEWGLVVGGALLVALIVRTFLVQAFWIPSASMEPTLHEGDRVLVNKLSYDLHEVNRFDVIVFERPEEPSAVPHPENEIQDLIKRVIGLPGDTIEARDGIVFIDGEPIDEPYVPEGASTVDLPRQEVPEGHLFVMGDNRENSHDSRKFGPIDESSIVGRAFVKIYPLNDIGGL